MILLLLAASALAAPQDGEVDRILVRFQTRQKGVQTEEAYRRLLADARTELETFVRNNPGHKDVPRAAYQIAETYLSARDLDRGLEQLRAYLRDFPSGPDAPAARFASGEILVEKEKDA